MGEPDRDRAPRLASGTVGPGYQRLAPWGCDPVRVRFVPPAGFEPTRADGASSARWSSYAASSDPVVVEEAPTWPDFITLSVRCAERPEAALDWAREGEQVHVERQRERPFKSSGDPRIRALRQKIDVIAVETAALPARLEIRKTYPDGVPGGFVYDRYEGRCWTFNAAVALELKISAPLAREEGARASFRALCSELAEADVRLEASGIPARRPSIAGAVAP